MGIPAVENILRAGLRYLVLLIGLAKLLLV